MPKILFALLVLAIGVLPLRSQQDPTIDSGFTPYGAFQRSDIDSVNIKNGNLIVHIPIASYPQRGGTLKLSYSARYNSTVWAVQTLTNPITGKATQHWAFKSGGIGVVQDQSINQKYYLDDNMPSGYDAITITTADGTQHILESAEAWNSSPNTDYRSLDASGYLWHDPASSSDISYGKDSAGVMWFVDSIQPQHYSARLKRQSAYHERKRGNDRYYR